MTAKALAVPKSVILFGKLNNQLETQLQIHRDPQNREDKFQSCSVKGIVQIEKMPKYEQTGSSQQIKIDLRYLVVYVTKLNVIEAIENFGDPSIWVDVEWGGHRFQSNKIKGRPVLGKYFYFQLAIPEKTLKTAEKAVVTDAIL